MAYSNTNAKAARICVEMSARGVDCEPHARDAAYAVATWLDKQDIPTLLGDYIEYDTSLIKGESEPTAGARRFESLLDQVGSIAHDAATVDWANPDGADVTVTIIPYHTKA